MAIGTRTAGEKRLETVIDFEPEKFRPTWDTVAHKMLGLDIDQIPRTLYADAFDIPTEVILRCAIYRSAIDAFATTDMAGINWHWGFRCDTLPVGEARIYARKNAKIRICSTAKWEGCDVDNGFKYLWVNIGDFEISPIEE